MIEEIGKLNGLGWFEEVRHLPAEGIAVVVAAVVWTIPIQQC